MRHPDEFKPDDVPSCSDLRLFSAGGGNELLEWDIDTASVKVRMMNIMQYVQISHGKQRTISSQGGSIWCMAVNPASSLLALGCEDGTVRLLSLANDTLSHFRRFDRVKCRLLSIAWGPPTPRPGAASVSAPRNNDGSSDDDDDDDDNWVDTWLVTGGSDSSIRKWDVSTGRVVDRMGTDKMRGERTLVWTVGVIGSVSVHFTSISGLIRRMSSDGTIVSGDSLGMVKFWDSRTCTQLQSFRAHNADVLCLAIGPVSSLLSLPA
jgi:U3 small nucleolar RNA-associated protein 4